MFTLSAIIKNVVKFKPFRSISFSKFSEFYKLCSNEKLPEQRFKLVHASIASVLENQEFLSVSEWKSVVSELQKNAGYKNTPNINRDIFKVLITLRPPNDSMKNAQNFIEARNLKLDVCVKRVLIQLYTKKAFESKLTENEEQQLIDL